MINKINQLLQTFEVSIDKQPVVKQLLKSNIRPRKMEDDMLIYNLKRHLSLQERQQFDHLIGELSLSHKNSLLYILNQLNNQNNQQKLFTENDQIIETQADIPKVQQSSPLLSSQINTTKQAKIIPAFSELLTEKQLVYNAMHLLQGIEGQLISLSASPQTGMFVPQVHKQLSLYKSHTYFLQSVGETGGLFLRIQKELKNLLKSSSKYKKQIAAFLEEQLQRYLLELQKIDQQNTSLDQLFTIVQQVLKPILLFSNLVIDETSINEGFQTVTIPHLHKFMNNFTFLPDLQVLQKNINAVTNTLTQSWVQNGEIVDPEFFIGEKSGQLQSPFEEKHFLKNSSIENAQIIFNLGRNTNFIKTALGQINYQLKGLQLNEQLSRNTLMQLLQESNKFVREQLFNQHQTFQMFQLIEKMFLGFSGDFLTDFCLLQRDIENQVGSNQVYKIAALNQLDGVIQQCNLHVLFKKDILQNVQIKFMQEIRKDAQSNEFIPTLVLQNPLNNIILKSHISQFEKAFTLIYVLRKFELLTSEIYASRKSAVKQYGAKNVQQNVRKQVKTMQALTFKLQHLLKHFSTYISTQFAHSFQSFADNVEQNWDAECFVLMLISALDQFGNALNRAGLEGQLCEVIGRVAAQFGAFDREVEKCFEQKQFAQLSQLCAIFQQDVANLLQQIKKVQGQRDEELDLFIDGINW